MKEASLAPGCQQISDIKAAYLNKAPYDLKQAGRACRKIIENERNNSNIKHITLHIDKADIQRDIYFPKNSNGVSLDDGNRQFFLMYIVNLLEKNQRYRVKYVLEEASQKCNLDRKNLNNGYFKNISIGRSHFKEAGPFVIF
ncbi:hypothetical protein H8356DRAFT_1327410 [Neocallimastix lanati (nom. inval.)]|nr:hypothetical protein H8356DRAFT_1327410 [Neocallimastix sp. JGI-2020a]